MLDAKVTGFEVHARICKNGKTVFRIWDGNCNRYATKVIRSQEAAARCLIELETSSLDKRIKELKEEIRIEAPKRVVNAKEDGFETCFVTSGELNDPWHKEGDPIIRGI